MKVEVSMLGESIQILILESQDRILPRGIQVVEILITLSVIQMHSTRSKSNNSGCYTRTHSRNNESTLRCTEKNRLITSESLFNPH